MKYVPSFTPTNVEELPRHIDQEIARIADAVDINRWEHTHIHVEAAYNAGNIPYIFADATSGAFTISLPAPIDEMILNIKKIDSSANAVTLDAGSNTIDGSSTAVMATQYESLTLYWDKTSTEWWIV